MQSAKPVPVRSCRLSRLILVLAGLFAGASPSAQEEDRRLSSGAAEVIVGDRLFFETRFAQYFFAHSNGDVNAVLREGDLVVRNVVRSGQQALPGPFRGQSMSCRHCHLGDDFLRSEPLAQRTYSDFSARSAIPARDDGLTHTSRNSQMMVDFGLAADVARLRHFDGEFVNPQDLVTATLTGRNMGWQFSEYDVAVAHIARVIREDSGLNARYVRGPQGRGLPYRVVMMGGEPSLPPYLRLPLEYRLDVRTASDVEILQAVARLMHAYMDSIRFGNEDTGRAAGSPYDLFLTKNDLPTAPNQGESSERYAARLINLIARRPNLTFVEPTEGEFRLHNQVYRFGADELAGLKIFFAQDAEKTGVGNCVSCHEPPQFTDHRFHNTGVSQSEYDAVFGAAAFAEVHVPGLAARAASFDTFMPATRWHPNATSRFRSAPARHRPGFADLGVWNVFANPDYPKPQAAMMAILCAGEIPTTIPCTADAVLPYTIALFKTPSIRDLGHSDPYFHSGTAETIEAALLFYVRTSALARQGRVRNGSPQLARIRITEREIASLAAFLRSLNEDYH